MYICIYIRQNKIEKVKHVRKCTPSKLEMWYLFKKSVNIIHELSLSLVHKIYIAEV